MESFRSKEKSLNKQKEAAFFLLAKEDESGFLIDQRLLVEEATEEKLRMAVKVLRAIVR